MGKNIVVCSDGTGNEGGLTKESNVFKLYRKIIDNESQSTFYDRGLGTEPPYNWIRNNRIASNVWNYSGRLVGRAFGSGISKNVRDCYYYIVDNYVPGDRIYLFGFSRGAFTVRSLGGLVATCGILKKKYRKLTPDAYAIYRNYLNDKENANEFGKRFSHTKSTDDEKIRTGTIFFIGVWDTVGALGLPVDVINEWDPFQIRFHNTKLDKYVSYGYQALAIDDQRRVFKPVLWNETEKPSFQTIEQVWFAGMHSDVGGGYQRTGLSDVACEWMIEKAEQQGLLMETDWRNEVNPEPEMKPMHDSRQGLGKFYRKKIRNINQLSEEKGIDTVKVHQSVITRKERLKYNPINFPTNIEIVL